MRRIAVGDFDVTAIPGIAPSTQTTINIVVGVAIAVAAIWKYFSRRPDPIVNPEVQIVASAFADRSALERLAEVIAEATLHLKRIAETKERLPESVDRATQTIERIADQLQRALNQHGEDLERSIARHGADLGHKIDDAARYLRANL